MDKRALRVVVVLLAVGIVGFLIWLSVSQRTIAAAPSAPPVMLAAIAGGTYTDTGIVADTPHNHRPFPRVDEHPRRSARR